MGGGAVGATAAGVFYVQVFGKTAIGVQVRGQNPMVGIVGSLHYNGPGPIAKNDGHVAPGGTFIDPGRLNLGPYDQGVRSARSSACREAAAAMLALVSLP